jgi:uncharacterized protein YjiS (DUF1127 family)
VEPDHEGEIEMASVAVTCSKMPAPAAEAGDRRPRNRRGVARWLGLWRQGCMVLARWDTRARQGERLNRLDDRLLADIGLTREKQIVAASQELYWLR